MNKDYILLAGPAKPPPAIILPAVVDELHHLHSVGVDASTPDGKNRYVLNCFVISQQKHWSSTKNSIMVTSAVPTVLTKVCPVAEEWCIYLMTLTDHEHMQKFNNWLTRLNQLYGIKGTSLLAEYSDIIKGILIDYMQSSSWTCTSLLAAWYAMHVLIISSDMLNVAHQLLQYFYQHMPNLYGKEWC